MPSSSLAFVAFARIGLVKGTIEPTDFGAALETALTPGTAALHRNRLWRLPQHHSDDGWITGRVGFELIGTEAGVGDEALKDYRVMSAAQLTRT